jgi:HemX protein
MEVVVKLLNTLLPLLYALVVVAYAIDFRIDEPVAARIGRRLMEASVALHVLYVGLRTVLYRHIPLAATAEVATTVALALALVYLFVERRTREHRTGAFVIAVAFVLQTASSAFIESPGEFPKLLRSPLFGIHTIAAVVGYTAFALSAIYGVLFLLLYHELKTKRFGLIYDRLPPLEALARMSVGAIGVGVAALAITISCGAIWARREFPGFTRDPKFLLTVATWLVYLAVLFLHRFRHWSGRRTIGYSLVGFLLLVFSFLAAHLWLESFHAFA